MEKPRYEDATADWEDEGGSVARDPANEEARELRAPVRESLIEGGRWVIAPRFLSTTRLFN